MYLTSLAVPDWELDCSDCGLPLCIGAFVNISYGVCIEDRLLVYKLAVARSTFNVWMAACTRGEESREGARERAREKESNI